MPSEPKYIEEEPTGLENAWVETTNFKGSFDLRDYVTYLCHAMKI